MNPTLCIIGGCNGAGKTTLARELLPRMGIMRFLNADEIASGLSPLDPTLSAFRAGRILIEEARALLSAKASFAIESTLSGKTYIAMLRNAKEQGYRIVLHYMLIGSASQAVDRIALRVIHGGHHVPEDEVCRRFDRSRKHAIEDYLPLADDWGVWDNRLPPAIKIAGSGTHSLSELNELLISSKLMETTATKPDNMTEMVLEASEAATAKMLDYYKRMGIRVTPQMTLAPEPKKRARKAN
ncbi:MAG: AAA family ATPase [Verrucomicrobiota bacterium]|jgi:predicted ABC-type ATPase|nr:AAA family ATPase [Verrucomicrobiota bacterium]